VRAIKGARGALTEIMNKVGRLQQVQLRHIEVHTAQERNGAKRVLIKLGIVETSQILLMAGYA
jgi:hypothetical protein